MSVRLPLASSTITVMTDECETTFSFQYNYYDEWETTFNFQYNYCDDWWVWDYL